MKPTSGDDTTFTTGIGSNQNIINTSNESGDRYIAYLWHSVSGYSKFGTYSGNGSATGPTVTLGFRPALVMIKRTDSTGNWYIFDTTRDPDNKGQRYLRPNLSNAEGGSGTGTEYVDFQSNGFQIIASGSDFGEGNTSGGTYFYAAFAGGLDTIAPVNTDGDVDSRVKASDDTGFAVGRFEKGSSGTQTVGHGLSSAPDWLMVKRLDSTGSWFVYHSSNTADPETDYLRLNSANDTADDATIWGDTAPTSSVFSVGSGFNSGEEISFYAWTATTGKSAFGKYTGNNSATGPEVTGLGFAPALIIIKSTDGDHGWAIQDKQRDGNNPNGQTLFPELSNAEYTSTGSTEHFVDFNSDGFQIKNTNTRFNVNGNDYIYMAFADGRDASFFHDESGQANHFDPENVQNYDVVPDSPTNTFCTINPLAAYQTNANLSEGNLSYNKTSATGWRGAMSTFAVSSGKWYWEVTHTGLDSNSYAIHGVVDADVVAYANVVGEKYIGQHSGLSWYLNNGDVYVNASVTKTIGSGATNLDVIGYALDMDAGTFDIYKNGEYVGEAGTGLTGTQTPAFSIYTGSSSVIVNFGQDDSFGGILTPGGYTDAEERGSFKYPVPSGFLSLCSRNLPEPDISPVNGEEPADYFDTQLWTGTGSGQSFSNWSFQPDWLWFKHRTALRTMLCLIR